jgi:tellurite resistance protein TehA-like permease
MNDSAPPALWRRLAGAVAELFPGYFALVMATGIVSLAAFLLGIEWAAHALFWVNVGAYGVLCALVLARIAFFPARVFADLCDHGRGPGFFTLVAGTCVLGVQVLVIEAAPAVAHALWILGIALWFVVMYGFFTAVVVREQKPTLEEGINGAWLLAIVATQGVAVLGSLLAPTLRSPEPALFFALGMFLLGASLYLTIITLIFYRFTFLPMTTARLTPPYWINMGAVAITTLAGSTLLLAHRASPLLELIRPFLTGFTLFFWATATWWIPLLVILGVWRHALRRFPLRYDPQYWGMVFPLGMYTVATFRLGQAAGIDYIAFIPGYFVYVALAAWTIVFAGMLASLLSALAPALPRPASSGR